MPHFQAEKEAPPTLGGLADKLHAAGFQVVGPSENRLRIQKGPCAAVLENVPGKGIRFAEPPGYVVGQYIARLDDRGFQKFLTTPQLRMPALAEHLQQVHSFTEELRAALGVASFYNEALGTVSDRYLYDRVAGRE